MVFIATFNNNSAFLGLILSMGVVKKKPAYETYWENNSRSRSMETPNFSLLMSRNRFQLILQFLNCNNYTIVTDIEGNIRIY